MKTPDPPFRRFLVFTFLFLIAAATSVNNAEAKGQTTAVEEVLTGDSLRLSGGKTFRYAGLQAPPLQSKIPLLREYGAQSLEFNKSLVAGKNIRIEWDSQIRDDAGRLIGYAYLEDGTFINAKILKEGHAKARVAAPNLKHAKSLRQAELDARRGKKGLWREEPDNPYLQSEYIGEKNTKIYYFPTSPELDDIPEANLVKFRSRVDAKAAGYRPCFDCRGKDDDFEI